MFHIGKTKVPVILGAYPLFNITGNKYDDPTIGNIQEKSLEEETGLDRVKKMFSRDKNFDMSTELQNIISTTTMSFVAGGILGGTLPLKTVVVDFIEKHQETQFQSQFQAQKKLQNEVLTKFIKNFAVWGAKAGLFTAVFMTTSNVLSVYRGYTQILDYTIGGALTGALFKANLGLRATIAGCIIGGTISTIGSALCFGITSLAGFVVKDHRDFESLFQKRNIMRLEEKAQKKQNDDTTRNSSGENTDTNDTKKSVQ